MASVQHHLPSPDFNLDELHSLFAKHGLTLVDLIALSGRYYRKLEIFEVVDHEKSIKFLNFRK